jgi:hypothetical protein
MRIIVLPKSLLGRCSIGLVVASLIFFVMSELILGPGPDYNMTLAYALTGLIICLAGAAFVMGLIGVIKKRERSILVFIAIAIGLYSFIGGIGSLLVVALSR